MLAADKLLLTSTIRKNATELKGKELELHKTNFDAVGTQAWSGKVGSCGLENDRLWDMCWVPTVDWTRGEWATASSTSSPKISTGARIGYV